MKRIGRSSILVIEEADGTPFIGSVRERASRVNMKKYWEERDGWRAKDELEPKWAGTNIDMAFGLLRRNGGLEDHATMLRLTSDKLWDHSRHGVQSLHRGVQGIETSAVTMLQSTTGGSQEKLEK